MRRWLGQWVDDGRLTRTGQKKAAKYLWVGHSNDLQFAFLDGLNSSQRHSVLSQLRDLWTHNSTALEGNTLSLGDTHFVLEQGLTISGKSLKDHQEIVGHANAIELLYECLNDPVSEEKIFQLHRAIQTEKVRDIYKPEGAWKVEPNGAYVVTDDGEQKYMEYADPDDVADLMSELTDRLNSSVAVTVELAPEVYAGIHMGVVHVHPFWDGNGRIARLLANIPLLKSGLPPIVIPATERRRYIEILSRYQLAIGKLSTDTGVWPDESMLREFIEYCASCYATTESLLGLVQIPAIQV